MLREDYKALFEAIPVEAANQIVEDIWSHRNDVKRSDFVKNDLFLDMKFQSGDILRSQNYNDMIFSYSFYISILNRQLNILDRLKSDLKKRFRSSNQDFAASIRNIQSSIDGIETSLYEDYTQTKVYTFDGENSSNGTIVDNKRKVALNNFDKLFVEPGAGALLPLKDINKVAIRNITVDYENTSVGDSQYPIESTDPNILIDGEPFIWRIVRKTKIPSEQKVYVGRNKVTLEIDFGSYQAFNIVDIDPGAIGAIRLDRIYYNNIDGLQEIVFNQVLELTNKLFFSTIYAAKINVEFTLLSRVANKEIKLKENISSLYNNKEIESIGGILFDGTLKKLHFLYQTYKPFGYWLSKPININSKLVGVDIDLRVDQIESSFDRSEYGDNELVSDELSFVEAYVNLKTNQEIVTLPIPHEEYIYERISLWNRYGTMTFFPSTNYKSIRKKLASVTYRNTIATLIFVEDHGYEVGSQVMDVSILTSGDEKYNFVSPSINVIDSKTIKVVYDGGTIFDYLEDSNMYFVQNDQLSLFDLYANNTLLVLGTDYSVSLDNGETFLDTLPSINDIVFAEKQVYQVKIQLSDVNPSKIYYMVYRPDPNQKLDSRGYAVLKNGEFVITEDINESVDSIQLSLIMSNKNNDQESSPIIRYCKLKLREQNG